MMTTVDSHHHLWPLGVFGSQPWRPPGDTVLRRAFDLHEFEAELARSGIDGSIVMQSVDSPDENHRLAAYAAASDRILGWVGYADLSDRHAALQEVNALLAMRNAPGGGKLVGVRCLVGMDAMAWTADPERLTALETAAAAGLAWDVVPISGEQVEAVCRVAARLPELRIVVDHLASPPMDEDAAAQDAWRSRVNRLAAHSNVAIKLSVGVVALQQWSSWDDATLGRAVSVALEAFGPGRCMLASNWPVVLLLATHAEAWRGVQAAARHLDDVARAQVEGGTALRWYGLTT